MSIKHHNYNHFVCSDNEVSKMKKSELKLSN